MRGIDQRDRQRVLEVSLDRAGFGRQRAQPCGERLGRAVDAVDIVAGQVEPVAHFLPRQAGNPAGFGRQRLIDHLPAAGRSGDRLRAAR